MKSLYSTLTTNTRVTFLKIHWVIGLLFSQALYISHHIFFVGFDNDSDEIDEGDQKKPKKVRFAEGIKAAAKAVEIDERKHPLLTDLEDDDSVQKRQKKADKWFMKVRVRNIDSVCIFTIVNNYKYIRALSKTSMMKQTKILSSISCNANIR